MKKINNNNIKNNSQNIIQPKIILSKKFNNIMLNKIKSSKNTQTKIKLQKNNNILTRKIIKPEHDINIISTKKSDKNTQLEMPSGTTCIPVVAPAHDERMLVVAQAQASMVGYDEINRLIKKLTLSFSVQKNDSSFCIKEGLFEGARFHLHCEQRDLSLLAQHLTPDAYRVINTHQDYLRLRLKQKEINLANLRLNA